MPGMAIQPLFDEPFLRAQWDADFRTFTDTPLRTRILALDAEITALDTTIAQQETTLNAIIYRLYRLTPEEIATVEAG